MRRLLFTLSVLLVLPLAAQAQQVSVTYMALAGSNQFLNRVTFQIVLEAPLIEVEAVAYTQASGDTHPVNAACHTLRANLARAVSQNPSAYAGIFALHLITSSNVTTAGVLTGTVATLDTPANDAALFSAVSAMWSDIAGCVTNP